MTASTIVRIIANGTVIQLSIDEARELRDFLTENGEVTPRDLPRKEKK